MTQRSALAGLDQVGQRRQHSLEDLEVNSGAAIVGGRVYWGSGYANIDGTPNNKFYAFEVKEDQGKPDRMHPEERLPQRERLAVRSNS
jgi:hypothetical protein